MDRITNKKRVNDIANYTGILIVISLALTCLINTIFITTVRAADTVPLTLTVAQMLSGDGSHTPPSTTFTYRLTSDTADAPMPDGSTAEGFTFTITGTNEVYVGPINFNVPGVFTYNLSCITNNISGFAIDRRVYTIEVHVTNNLQVIVIFLNGDSKVSNLRFEHIHRMPSGPGGTTTPPETTPPTTPAVPEQTQPIESEKPSQPDIPSPPEEITAPEGSETPDASTVPREPNTSGDSPRTGDFSNPVFWITLICIAGILLFILFFASRRLKKE